MVTEKNNTSLWEWEVKIDYRSEGYYVYKCSRPTKTGDLFELVSRLPYGSELEAIEGAKKAIQLMTKPPVYF